MTTETTTAAPEIHVADIHITGQAPYRLFLLPEDAEELDFEAAQAWAKEQGGDLPNRFEQALLFAHQRDQFQRDWYWSNQQHESDEGCAWAQLFSDGGQISGLRIIGLRARAVRRLPL